MFVKQSNNFINFGDKVGTLDNLVTQWNSQHNLEGKC